MKILSVMKTLSAANLTLFGDQLTGIKIAVQKAKKALRSQRLAQKKFRDRQKQIREEQKDKIEKQSRELKREIEKRMILEQQLQQMKAENTQLRFRVDRSEEYSTVLQSSVKTLQRSLDLLCGDTNDSRHGSNRPKIGPTTISPATSQSGHESQIPSQPLSQLPHHLSKHAPHCMHYRPCSSDDDRANAIPSASLSNWIGISFVISYFTYVGARSDQLVSFLAA